MPIPFNKMFFAQNVMPVPVIEPDPDPGDPHFDPCYFSTHIHPRWENGGQNNYGSNWFGFRALPSGIRHTNGNYNYIGSHGLWWSSTESSSSAAWPRSMHNFQGTVNRGLSNKKLGFSVRCVRDETVGEASDPDGTIYTDDYTDGSGNKYDGVKIGEQVWTTKNLITTKYQNGDDIPTGHSDTDWVGLTTGAYTVYPDTTPYDVHDGLNSMQDVIDAYGMLYNWYAVDNGLVDNNGYRVPTDDDWTDLTDYLISEYGSDYNINSSNVALVLKSCRQAFHPQATEESDYEYIRYGYLYNWYATANNKKITSSDTWRVPDRDDYNNLAGYIDSADAGLKLKHCRQVWSADSIEPLCPTSVPPTWSRLKIGHPYGYGENHYGTNEYGFSLMGLGIRRSDGSFASYNSISLATTDEYPDPNDPTLGGSVYVRTLGWHHTSFSIESGSSGSWSLSKNTGHYIRLVRNATANEQNPFHASFIPEGTLQSEGYTGNDGKKYHTVRINNLVWTVENLAETKYRDSTDIQEVTDENEWASNTSGARCSNRNNIGYAFTNDWWLNNTPPI